MNWPKMLHPERLRLNEEVLDKIKIPIDGQMSMGASIESQIEAIERHWDILLSEEITGYDHLSGKIRDQDSVGPDFFRYFPESFISNKATQMAILGIGAMVSSGFGERLEGDMTLKDLTYRGIFDLYGPKTRAAAESHTRVLYHAFEMRRNNERIYRLSNNLFNVLMDSEYKSKAEILRAPYREIYVVFPPEASVNVPGVQKRAEGMYINLMDGSDETKRLALMITQRARSAEESADEDIYYCELFLRNDTDIEEQLVALLFQEIPPLMVAALEKDATDEDVKNFMTSFGTHRTLIEAVEFMRMACKILMYTTSTNVTAPLRVPPAKGPKDRKKPKYVVRERTEMPFFDLGHDIVISQIARDSQVSQDSNGSGGQHTYRYTVCGHWHHYWKLTSNVDSKDIILTRDNKSLVRKFLGRYWKGPELGDIVLHDYRVKI